MIDYLLKFASRAAAKADPDVRKFHNVLEDLFDSSQLITDVKVWRHSQDTLGTDADGNPTRTHNYIAGWYVLISLKNQLPAVVNHSLIQLVINRDKANARQPGTVIKSTVAPAILQDIRMEPVFAGADYPFGGMES